MNEFASDFLLDDCDIFFLVLVVEIELVVMLGDAEFATDALVAELPQTDDFLW